MCNVYIYIHTYTHHTAGRMMRRSMPAAPMFAPAPLPVPRPLASSPGARLITMMCIAIMIITTSIMNVTIISH